MNKPLQTPFKEIQLAKTNLAEVETILKGFSGDRAAAYKMIDRELRNLIETARFLKEYSYELLKEETVTCFNCGDQIQAGAADKTAKGYLCEDCPDEAAK